MSHLIRGFVLASALVLTAGLAQAGTIFTDNFNTENGGHGVLNYTGFANWNVTSGSVDLLGLRFFEYFPAYGFYLDMNGTTNQGGTITTKTAFAPGAYTVTFDFAGSQRGVDGNMMVTLGDLSQRITIGAAAGFRTYSFDVEVGPSGPSHLTFASGIPTGYINGLLDNVTVSTRNVAVPEPATALLLGSGLLGLGWVARRRRAR